MIDLSLRRATVVVVAMLDRALFVTLSMNDANEPSATWRLSWATHASPRSAANELLHSSHTHDKY